MSSTFKGNLWKVYLFKFLLNFHTMSAVLIPFFTDWGRISFTQIMILQSWFLFWIFVLEIPTGTIADFFGRKHSLFLGSLVNITGVLVYVSYPSFYVFMLGEFLWAVSAALISGADEAFVYDTLKKIKRTKESKRIFARIENFKLASILISAPIGSVIAASFGLRAPTFLMAIPLLMAFFVGLTFKEPKTTQKIESKRYIHILKEGVKFFYKNKVLKILALDMVVIASISYFMIWLYQVMLKQAGISVAYFGLIHAAFVASQILIMSNYERLERLLGSKKRLIFFSAFITGIMFIIGGLTSFTPIVLGVIFIGGGFGLSRRPLFSSYMNKYIPSPKRATILSTISMFRQIVLVIMNPIVGVLTDWSLNYTLIILGVIAVVFSFVSKVEENHLID